MSLIKQWSEKMKQRLEIKLLIIAGLILLLYIPIFMIQNLIDDRAQLQKSVQQDIAQSSSGEQQIIGPFIYAEYVKDIVTDGKVEQQSYATVLLPESLNSSNNLATFVKHRGIYKALLYRSKNSMQGKFDLTSLSKLKDKRLVALNLVMSIKDARGINPGTTINLDGETRTLIPGTEVAKLPDGIHIELDYKTLMKRSTLGYDIMLNLQGMRKLSIAPVGKETTVNMKADWPHPSFVGNYLPTDSTITDKGFAAKWQTNYFATNLQDIFDNCIHNQNGSNCYKLRARNLGVNLSDGVNHYLKSYRASNYALLVLVLVFASFFLLEVLCTAPIHPVQYGFVGLALAVFYLLLISLSEHLGFNLSYLISAIASSALLSAYVAGMLKNTKHGGAFLAGILFLYGLLYGLLSSEDYALLMGSILVFVVLGLIMLLTRKVNWYTPKQEKLTITE